MNKKKELVMNCTRETFKGASFRQLILGLVSMAVVILTTQVASAVPTVGLSIEPVQGSTGRLALTVTLVSDVGKVIRSAGLDIVFPSDKIAYSGMEHVDGATLKASVTTQNGAILRVGYVDTRGKDRVTLKFYFDRTTSEKDICIPIGIRPDGLEGDIKDARASSVRAYCEGSPEDIEIWGATDERAVLFLVVPRLSSLKSAAILYHGIDITAPLAMAGIYFFDPSKDRLYFILPGIEVPSGDYTIDMRWDYGDGQQSSSATISVRPTQ